MLSPSPPPLSPHALDLKEIKLTPGADNQHYTPPPPPRGPIPARASDWEEIKQKSAADAPLNDIASAAAYHTCTHLHPPAPCCGLNAERWMQLSLAVVLARSQLSDSNFLTVSCPTFAMPVQLQHQRHHYCRHAILCTLCTNPDAHFQEI